MASSTIFSLLAMPQSDVGSIFCNALIIALATFALVSCGSESGGDLAVTPPSSPALTPPPSPEPSSTGLPVRRLHIVGGPSGDYDEGYLIDDRIDIDVAWGVDQNREDSCNRIPGVESRNWRPYSSGPVSP